MPAVSSQCFVDRELEIKEFYQLLSTAGNVAQPLLKIIGPSGIGKSALLQHFKEICHKEKIPAVFVYGDNSGSIIDFLSELSAQLRSKAPFFAFREFDSAVKRLNHIQSKLLFNQKDGISKRLIGPLKSLGRGAIKAASTAAGADVLLAAATEVLGDMMLAGIEKQIDVLEQAGLNSNDIKFVQNIHKELVQAFGIGFKRISKNRKVVILVDGLEKIQHLEEWLTGTLIPSLNDGNIIFVISSRVSFSPSWLPLLPISKTLSLRPFILKDIREYLSLRKIKVGANAPQTAFKLTDGLPLGVALWSELPTHDDSLTASEFMHSCSIAVATQIEEHLLDQFSDEKLKGIVLICAAVRHFDEDLLAYLLDIDHGEAKGIFSSLQRYSSVFKHHPSGLTMHELLRHHLTISFRKNNLPRFLEINKRAKDYFEGKIQEVSWGAKGNYAIEYVYYASILEDQYDLMTLFFNEYKSSPIQVIAAKKQDLPQILDVDWKAFPNEKNRISLTRLEKWFAASPESFRVAKNNSDQIVGYSCILKLKPSAAQEIIDGTLSFKDINETHLLDTHNLTSAKIDYMMDSLAIANLEKVEVGAALLRDMFAQVKGDINKLLSVAVTQYGSDILRRSGFRLVRKLPDIVEGFQYEIYLLDVKNVEEQSLLARVLRKYSKPKKT